MSNSSGIRAGRAFVELATSDGKLIAGLRNAERRLRAFGASVRQIGLRLIAAGAAIATPLIASIKVFTSLGDKLDKMAGRTGIAVEALSELSYAADQSGADLDTLEAGVRRMQRTIEDAGRGMSTAQDALAGLGLSFQALAQLNPEQQFKLIADRLSRVADPTKRAALAMELLGRSGTQLLPLFANGASGIEALQKQARDLGLTISTQTAHDAAVLNDTLHELWLVVKNAGMAIGAALAPAVTKLAGIVTQVLVKIVDWIKRNRELVVGVAAAAVALGAIGGAFVALGVSVQVAAFALAGIATALAAILSPVGMVITAIAGLGVAIATYTGAGGKAIGWLMDRFGELRSFVGDVVEGITNELAAGEPEKAAKVLWLALKVVWQTGVNWLNGVWISAKHFFIKTAQEMWYGALTVAEQVWHGLEVAWIETVSFLSKTWTNFVADIQLAWGGIQNWLSQRWLDLFALFGSLTEEQAALAKDMANEDFANDARGVESKRNQALADSETRRANALASADKEHIAALRQIDTDLRQALAGLNTENDPALQKTRDELEAAREALAVALEQARRDRENAARGSGSTGDGPKVPNPEDLAAAVGSRMAITGTFNPAALWGMGGGSAFARLAQNVEKIERNTRPAGHRGATYG